MPRTSRNDLGRRFRCFSRSEKGAAAVEFAMVAFPFLLMLGWIVETAMVLSTEYFLQQSVEDASRRIRIGKVATDATNATQFKALVCAQLWVVTNCSGTVAIWVNNAADFATLAPPQPLTVDTGDTLPYVPGVGQRAVAVIATYDWTFTVPGMTFLSNVSGSKRRLQGVSVFRNEPF